MKILPFGDSHCLFIAGATAANPTSKFEDTAQILWMGPAKIWGLKNPTINKTKEKFESLIKGIEFEKDTIPVATFGEIDIRINIPILCVEGRSFDPVEKLAKEYLNTLSTINSETVVIWGPPPTLYDSMDLRYPSSLDATSRNCLNHAFHEAILNELAMHPKIFFISFFYDFVDHNLNTIGGLEDKIHYSTMFSLIARKAIISAVCSGSRATLNFTKYNQIQGIKFEKSYTKPTGFSRQLFSIEDGTKLSFWLHRSVVPDRVKLSTLQIRTSSNKISQVKFNNSEISDIADQTIAYKCLLNAYGQEIATEYEKARDEFDRFIQNQFS
jgi:hypothetical protein